MAEGLRGNYSNSESQPCILVVIERVKVHILRWGCLPDPADSPGSSQQVAAEET